MSLEDLKKRLLTGLKFDDSVNPGDASIPTFRPDPRQAKGWVGEDGMSRIAERRGEIVLDVGSGIEDVNKGGPDLVTLAEDASGELKVRFYDNKSYASDRNIREVSALERTFEDSRAYYEREWKGYAADESRPEAERELFKLAAGLVDKDHGSYDRVVTNWLGQSNDVTRSLKERGIVFEDVRLPERASVREAAAEARPETYDSPFVPQSKLQSEAAAGEAPVDISVSPFQAREVNAARDLNAAPRNDSESPFSRQAQPTREIATDTDSGTAVNPLLSPKR